MAHRPRSSILSLFDPLSLSPTSDKENSVGETSFFHPPRSQTHVQEAHRTLRRRLIDIGDLTIDEPSMNDLLAMEDELEEINNNIVENDDGDTLTWRDMAKAATPKWTGRHASTFTTPKVSPTARTPLAEILFKDETTPMARKKSYRRQINPVSSKLTLVESPVTSPTTSNFPSPMAKLRSSNKVASLSIHAPTIEISEAVPDIEVEPRSEPARGTLESSTCTLNLPAHGEKLITDTSLPLHISPSSSQSSLSPSTLLTLPSAQPRPESNTLSPSNTNHRMSVDLQSSFQLHLSSSDTTFDLLNEKISFFSSKSGVDSFLHNLEIDDSFGEDDLKPPTHVKSDTHNTGDSSGDSSPCDPPESPRPDTNLSPLNSKATDINLQYVSSAECVVSSNNEPSVEPSASSSNSDINPTQSASTFLLDEIVHNNLSTPNPSRSALQHPPQPVPALKIVKRSKILSRRLSTAANAISTMTSSSNSTASPSRRTSTIPPVHLPTTRIKAAGAIPPSSLNNGLKSKAAGASQLSTINANKRASAPLISNLSQPTDGPRRVLLSEGPKNISSGNAKAAISDTTKASLPVNGPRRIIVNPVATIAEKPGVKSTSMTASQLNTGLKQPVKYGSIGSLSAIPKPVSRTAGSRLPAPASLSRNSRSVFTTTTPSGAVREVRRVT